MKLINKYKYKLWKHLNKKFGKTQASFYNAFYEETKNKIEQVLQEQRQGKTQVEKLLAEQSSNDKLEQLIQEQKQMQEELTKIVQENKQRFDVLSKSVETWGRLNYFQPAVVEHHKKVFPKYKGINKGKDVVLIASGPTLNYFTGDLLKDAVHVGVNTVFQKKDISLDYLFATDYKYGLKGTDKELIEYNPNCKKFFGLMKIAHVSEQVSKPHQFPFDFIEKCNAETFYITDSGLFSQDLSLLPLTSYTSCIFLAMRWILWTEPKRIFLVGADCGGAHFNNDKDIFASQAVTSLINQWKRQKDEIDTYYPNIEVISVNPVGLKGLFKDVYTKNYLKDHPEIDQDTVEILEDLTGKHIIKNMESENIGK